MSEFDMRHASLSPHIPPLLRKRALLEKMAQDRLRLVAAGHRGPSYRRSASAGGIAPANPGPLREIGPLLADHAPAIAASLLGLAVLGPRKTLLAAVRTAAPTLLVRGMLALLGRASH